MYVSVHASKMFKTEIEIFFSTNCISLSVDVVSRCFVCVYDWEDTYTIRDLFFWFSLLLLIFVSIMAECVFGHPQLSISIFSVSIKRMRAQIHTVNWRFSDFFSLCVFVCIWERSFWIRSVRHLRDEKMRWEVERNLINHSDN